MKKQLVIAFILFTLLTTITFKEKIIISQLNIKEIIVENKIIHCKQNIKGTLLFALVGEGGAEGHVL